MNIKLQKDLRTKTAGIDHQVFFNAAGSALPDQRTLDSIYDYLKAEAKLGGYLCQSEKAAELDRVYDNIAELINAQKDEIAITSNATNSFVNALYSIPFEQGDIIFCSPQEYGNNYLNYLHLRDTKGVKIKVMPYDQDGMVDIDALEHFLSDQVKLLVVTHIPTNGGFKLNAKEVGALAKKYGILYMLDACQSVGQCKVDVEDIQCDFLCATSRKFLRGPRGLGFLYVRKGILDQLNPLFHEALVATWESKEESTIIKSAKMYEHWEKPYALVMGLSTAIENILEVGIDIIEARIVELSRYLIEGLEGIPKVVCYEKLDNCHGIVGFNHHSFEAEELKRWLNEKGIEISTSQRMMSLLDMDRKNLDSCCRASVHIYNNEKDIDLLLDALRSYRD